MQAADHIHFSHCGTRSERGFKPGIKAAERGTVLDHGFVDQTDFLRCLAGLEERERREASVTRTCFGMRFLK